MKKILFMIILLAMNVSAANVIFKEGALDVDSSFASDYLKLDATSTPPVTCSATEQGAMYYDENAGKYKYCDGSSYEEIGTGILREDLTDGRTLSLNFHEKNIDANYAYDSSGNNEHTTIIGATHLATGGRSGDGAFAFDGINDAISLGDEWYFPEGDWTMNFWVNPHSSAAGNIIADEVSKAYRMTKTGANGINFYIWGQSDADYGNAYTGGSTVPVGQWTMITATYLSSTHTLSIFADTVNLDSDSIVGDFRRGTSGQTAYLGQSGKVGQEYFFNGSLDEFMVFSRVLNASEIEILFEQSEETHVPTPSQKDIHINSDEELMMPQVYSDTVGGTNRDLYIDNSGKLGYLSSSIRYKTNVRDLTDTKWIYSLRPVVFDYKNQFQGINQMGLIAEEVEEINPNVVSYNYDKKTDTKEVETVNYHDLIIPILAELQSKNEEIDILKSELCKKDDSYAFCNQAIKVQGLISYIEQPDFKGIIPKIEGKPIKNTYS